jgi:hypothetical protein
MQAFKRSKEATNQVFFAQIRHENAKEVFSQLGIAGLPTIFVWDSSAKAVTKAGKKITLAESKKVRETATRLNCTLTRFVCT